jgi:hypothetical protein
MKKKKFLAPLILLFCLSLTAQAQRTPFGVPNLLDYDKKIFHFGFLIGMNQSDFSIRSKADLGEYDSLMVINTSSLSGFNLGIVTNLRIGEYFDLRFIPGISFGERAVNYTIRYNNQSDIVTKKNI